jgi:hypothetical protein
VGRIQLWRGFSPLWPLQVQFITDDHESMLGGSNYGEGSEAVYMNGRFQMQGGKNWILPK